MLISDYYSKMHETDDRSFAQNSCKFYHRQIHPFPYYVIDLFYADPKLTPALFTPALIPPVPKFGLTPLKPGSH